MNVQLLTCRMTPERSFALQLSGGIVALDLLGMVSASFPQLYRQMLEWTSVAVESDVDLSARARAALRVGAFHAGDVLPEPDLQQPEAGAHARTTRLSGPHGAPARATLAPRAPGAPLQRPVAVPGPKAHCGKPYQPYL